MTPARCFECNSPNATWLSVSNAVTLCLACAGIHRSLGVHVSTVRSASLDTLREVEARTFAQSDNDGARADLGIGVYQGVTGVPPDVDAVRAVWESPAAVERRRRLRHAALRSLGRDPIAEEAAAAAERERYAALAAKSALSSGHGSDVTATVRRATDDREASCCCLM